MATLPFNRWTGTAQFYAQDAEGKVFLAIQGPNNAGKLIMVQGGVAKDITAEVVPDGAPAPVGQPAIDCVPQLGLWFTGNQEVAVNLTPPRYKVAHYKPFPSVTDPRTDTLVAQNAKQADQIASLVVQVAQLGQQNSQQAQQMTILQQQIAAQTNRMNEIETALANAGQGGGALTPAQAAALDWLMRYKQVLSEA